MVYHVNDKLIAELHRAARLLVRNRFPLYDDESLAELVCNIVQDLKHGEILHKGTPIIIEKIDSSTAQEIVAERMLHDTALRLFRALAEYAAKLAHKYPKFMEASLRDDLVQLLLVKELDNVASGKRLANLDKGRIWTIVDTGMKNVFRENARDRKRNVRLDNEMTFWLQIRESSNEDCYPRDYYPQDASKDPREHLIVKWFIDEIGRRVDGTTTVQHHLLDKDVRKYYDLALLGKLEKDIIHETKWTKDKAARTRRKIVRLIELSKISTCDKYKLSRSELQDILIRNRSLVKLFRSRQFGWVLIGLHHDIEDMIFSDAFSQFTGDASISSLIHRFKFLLVGISCFFVFLLGLYFLRDCGYIDNKLPKKTAVTNALPTPSKHSKNQSDGKSNSASSAKPQGSKRLNTSKNVESGINIIPTIRSSIYAPFTSISAGAFHVCLLRSDGIVMCGGRNLEGQLGDGTRLNRDTPSAVSDLVQGSAVSSGGFHTCALSSPMNHGYVKCWGDNQAGQVGNGSLADRFVTPALVRDLSNVVSVTAGGSHTCALLNDTRVKCWGFNKYGQLGDGTKVNRLTPVSGHVLEGVTSISAGSNHTCALLSNRTVRCWGNNDFGQLGDGTVVDRPVSITVAGLSGVIAIGTGGDHTCALLSDRTVNCWGRNDLGQLGDGTRVPRPSPTSVIALGDIALVRAGHSSTFALLTNGEVKCWGACKFIRFTNTQITHVHPSLASNLSGIASISVGKTYMCALLSDGHAKCQRIGK